MRVVRIQYVAIFLLHQNLNKTFSLIDETTTAFTSIAKRFSHHRKIAFFLYAVFFAAKLNARCDCCIDTNWMKNTHTSKLLFIILIMMLTHSTRCEAVVCFSMHFKWNLAAHDYSSFFAASVQLQFIQHDNKSLNNCPRKNSLFCALQMINLMRWRDTTWSILRVFSIKCFFPFSMERRFSIKKKICNVKFEKKRNFDHWSITMELLEHVFYVIMNIDRCNW